MCVFTGLDAAAWALAPWFWCWVLGVGLLVEQGAACLGAAPSFLRSIARAWVGIETLHPQRRRAIIDRPLHTTCDQTPARKQRRSVRSVPRRYASPCYTPRTTISTFGSRSGVSAPSGETIISVFLSGKASTIADSRRRRIVEEAM